MAQYDRDDARSGERNQASGSVIRPTRTVMTLQSQAGAANPPA